MNMIGNQASGIMGAYLSIKNANDPDARVSYIRKAASKKTKKKQLNYNHREISAQILRASKARTASGVLARAKSKLSVLKRCQGTGQYNETELRYAIAHARRMVQCATKKMQNLKEEEMLQGKLEREHNISELQRKAEARQRAARKEQQLKQKLVIKEMQQNRELEQEWQELVRKMSTNRNRERSKINEADMKYIRAKIESMREQGYSSNSSEMAELQGCLDEISRQELELQMEQETAGMTETAAGMTGAACSAATIEGGAADAASAIGNMVDICL